MKHKALDILSYSDFDRVEYSGCVEKPITVYRINGQDVAPPTGIEIDRAGEAVVRCPYCDSTVSAIDQTSSYPSTFEMGGGDYDQTFLYRCTACAFWAASVHLPEFASRRDFMGAGVLRKYSPVSPAIPLTELAAYLNSHPAELRLLDPRLFERLVAECFRAVWKPVDVIHVGGPADGGVDVVLIVSENKRWLVQCKRRRSGDSVEGVATVRSLLGALLAEGELRGVVVFSADHFSYHARSLASAKSLTKAGYEIKLIDYGVLREMMGEMSGALQTPWAQYFDLLATEGIIEVRCKAGP